MAEAAHVGCRDRTREATRGNANRGETYPPAMHAAARYHTGTDSDSVLHAPFFVVLRTFLPGLTFEDTRLRLMYVDVIDGGLSEGRDRTVDPSVIRL